MADELVVEVDESGGNRRVFVRFTPVETPEAEVVEEQRGY